MALAKTFNPNIRGPLKSGQFYSFRYLRYQNDPDPTVLFLYYIRGVNPNTKNRWGHLQCINLNYLSPGQRIRFFNTYKKSIRGKIARTLGRVDWKMINKRYPELIFATRRYKIPFIRNIHRIPIEEVPETMKRNKYYRPRPR